MNEGRAMSILSKINFKKIPQKGRIRFVLALILLVIAVRHTLPHVNNFFAERAERRRAAVEEREQKKAARHIISFDDLRALVDEHGLPLNDARQTIIRDRGRDTLSLSLSIDTSLQNFARRLFRRYKPRYAALAAIDPATGRVLALASFANEGEEIPADNLFLRAIFPAASVFKTVVAAAGVERAGMNSRTAIQHYGRHHTLFRTQLQENLRAAQDISLRDAFAYSVNPAFARIALFNTNKDVVFDMGKRFGFNDAIPFEFSADTSVMYYPDGDFSVAEFASGFNRSTTISPLFGALLAGAVAQGGVIFSPTVVDSVRSSRRDTLVYERENREWRRAFREQTAVELRTLFTAVTRYGTARRSFRPLRDSQRFRQYEYGGKTGNVNQLGLGRVDWFVGYALDPEDATRKIAVGVVTTHGDFWTVQSSFIAAEMFKRFFIMGG